MATTMYSEIMRLAPLRYYPLSDASGSGTAVDKSSNAQNGTVNGGVTFAQSSLLKASTIPSALFNGSTGYIDCPTTGLPAGSSSFSLLIWAKFTSVPGAGNYPILMDLGNNTSTHDAALYFNGDTQHLTFGFKGLTDISSLVTATAGHIYFLVGTYDGTTGRFYCYDSTSRTSDVNSHAEAHSFSYGAMRIGVSTGTAFFFSGTAAHAAVLGFTLSADQITRLYTVGLGSTGAAHDNHRACGRTQ